MNTLKEDLLGAIARGWCSKENEHKEMDPDLANAIYKEVSAFFKQKMKEILPDEVSTRTWGKFFKGTSFDNDKKHSIDIKCAYTNGYNEYRSELLKRVEEEV